jgi:hypothetical protein
MQTQTTLEFQATFEQILPIICELNHNGIITYIIESLLSEFLKV